MNKKLKKKATLSLKSSPYPLLNCQNVVVVVVVMVMMGDVEVEEKNKVG